MNGSEWRQRFAEYRAAQADHDRACSCLDQLQLRLAACITESERLAVSQGIAVAERRARLTVEQLALATNAFTQGRSVLAAIWDAPDDV